MMPNIYPDSAAEALVLASGGYDACHNVVRDNSNHNFQLSICIITWHILWSSNSRIALVLLMMHQVSEHPLDNDTHLKIQDYIGF